ncbi:glycerophosphodiester phosphodiesterase [Corynebacterium guangdongense]|uniref:Glycerophosphoryl diester phosphodiesterase n=1 Tax=Corynebacterium guangdongense TaxID=1783348 RepID=A0ABU1ZZX0_9CORY|nr:glycerophosphodiester phosphodiesterase family protein [Corynebacterium guangdongense]MDR7330486.1 glycerophosphoryl diester phosphodiesterase [Corynebacterium guangdongense]WJZ19042.1 putative glycerophosphoryl diester phosphodiesterase 1 [Corynebacterium guangdongense]
MDTFSPEIAPKIVAHRGNAPGFAENTAAAFENALAMPIHGVECDVRFSRDGVVMVQHDATVDRTSDGTGRLADLTAAQLRSLNVGTTSLPQRMMTLEELLEMVLAAGDRHLYLEIKSPALRNQRLEEEVVRCLTRHALQEDPRIHVISFSHSAMRRIARLAPRLDRWYLRRDRELDHNPGDLLFSRPRGLGLSIEAARRSPRLVDARGLPTYLWTVNDRAGMKFAESLGVDVLATDRPDVALELFFPEAPVLAKENAGEPGKL